MNGDMITQFPLFANLKEREVQALLAVAQVSTLEKGEILFEEGSLTENFYGIVEGEVDIVRMLGTSDERILAVRKKGTILGEMGIFTQRGTHTATVRARTALSILVIPFEQFKLLLQSSPDMTYALLCLYSSRLEESESTTIEDLREKNRQLTKAYKELQEAQAVMIEKEKLEHELQIASQIQRGILPESLPNYMGLDFGALMISARHVGGDFYDLIQLDDYHVGIMVGDVCDKGVPAALFMALAYSSIRTESYRHPSPGSTLRAVNQHLLAINRSNMFVTLLYGIFDCRTSMFTYARAGHPEPLVMDGQNQPVEVPHGKGQPLGILDKPVIDEQCITIPAGGTLLVFSDGLSETLEEEPNSLPLASLCFEALQGNDLTAQQLCDHLWKTVSGSGEISLIKDDFTVVALRTRGK